MSLSSLVTMEKVKRPHFAIIYGEGGIGKTTFCSKSPSPLILDIEDGAGELECAKISQDKFSSYGDFISVIQDVLASKHSYQTLVIDSLDALENLIFRKIAKENGKKSIEEIGYGKGYSLALNCWIDLVGLLREVRSANKMNILMVGHARVKSFRDPAQNASYDKYYLELNDKASEFLRNQVDSVLFCQSQVFVKETDFGKAKAYGEGVSVMYTEFRPGFFAKNRSCLPFSLPLDWDAFDEAYRQSKDKDSAKIKISIEAVLSEFAQGSIDVDLVGSHIEAAGDDAEKLEKILNRLRLKLS